MATESTNPLPRLARTLRSQNDYKQAMLQLAPIITGGKWTDMNESDIGVAIVSLIAAFGEALEKRIDDSVLLGFVRYCFDRKGLIELAALTGFKFETEIPASVNLQFTIPQARKETIYIPSGSRFATNTNPPVYFTTSNDASIQPGELSSTTFELETNAFEIINAYTIDFITGGNIRLDYLPYYQVMFELSNGNRFYDRVKSSTWIKEKGMLEVQFFDANLDDNVKRIYKTSELVPAQQGFLQEANFVSSGLTNQEYILQNDHVGFKTWQVYVNDIEWACVDFLTESKSTDQVYWWEVDANNLVHIKFGDGIRGAVPRADDKIVIYYLETMGASGNVSPNTIIVPISKIYTSDGNTTEITVTNPSQAVGGRDKITVERAQELIPTYNRTNKRAVTADDYSTWLKTQVPGVSRLKAYGIAQDKRIPFRVVRIFAIPEGGGQISDAMKDQLYKAANQDGIVGNLIEIRPWIPVDFDLKITVQLYEGVNWDGVRYMIDERVRYYVSDQCLDFDDSVRIYESGVQQTIDPDFPKSVHQAISSIPGIRSIQYNRTNDISLSMGEFPVVNNLEIELAGVIMAN